MTLYLHPSSACPLSDAYEKAFKEAEEIFVLSAYLRDWKKFDASNECSNATLIVGKDFGITRKQALYDCLEWKKEGTRSRHVYVADKIDGFHPKIVVWKANGEHYLIIGSSNLTIAAFATNYEANLRIKISEDRYREILDWVADILKKSSALTRNWIASYNEAPTPKNTKNPTPSTQTASPGHLTLPRSPMLASMLSHRKDQQAAFEEIRNEFEDVVRNCANGILTSGKFYDWLIEHWNNSEWKFQGNGIFRQKIGSTNWKKLCQSLVTCIDCPEANRDQTVVNIFNQMEMAGDVQARRAFLTEMLCHFFPDDSPLWNTPVVEWLKSINATNNRRRGLSIGEKYLWLAGILRQAVQLNPNFPAENLAELDTAIWAYCKHKRLI